MDHTLIIQVLHTRNLTEKKTQAKCNKLPTVVGELVYVWTMSFVSIEDK